MSSHWHLQPSFRGRWPHGFHDFGDVFGFPYGHGYLGEMMPAHTSKDFKIAVDLRGFAPEEISVKVVEDTLRVEAHHESQTEHGGHVLKSYKQEFSLPADVDVEALKSSLNVDGTLRVTAPKRGAAERVIPIEVVTGDRDAAATGAEAGEPGPSAAKPEAKE